MGYSFDLDYSSFTDHEPSSQIGPADPQSPIFTHTQFVGYLKKMLAQDRHGSWTFSVEVPSEMAERVIKLYGAASIPLHFDIQVWKPFVEDLAANDSAAG